MKVAFLLLATLSAAMSKAMDEEKAMARLSDSPEKRLSLGEIVSAPRRKTVKTPVPADAGCYIGSGVYLGHKGCLERSGFCFTRWSPSKLDYDEMFDLCIAEGVGNTLQFWSSGESFAALARKAKDMGL